MVGLIDIGDLTDTVELRGKQVELQGVSVAVITTLLASSDELRRIFAQKAVDGEIIANLISFAPLAVARFIAAGCGKVDDNATITFALQKLSAGESTMILEKLIPLTFPQGLQSFVQGLAALAPESVKRGWGADMNSQSPLPSAFGMDIQSESAGDTRPESSPATAN